VDENDPQVISQTTHDAAARTLVTTDQYVEG